MDLGLGTAEQYTFSALSNKLLGQAQDYQFQEIGKSGSWLWGTYVTDDGNWTTVDRIMYNSNSDIPRSYHSDAGTNSETTFYNVPAAFAESADVSVRTGNAPDSVCPSGWMLPTNTGGKSYARLIQTSYGFGEMNYQTDGAAQKAMVKIPFTFRLDGNYFAGPSNYRTTATYWTHFSDS